jgi:hypothetical protein
MFPSLCRGAARGLLSASLACTAALAFADPDITVSGGIHPGGFNTPGLFTWHAQMPVQGTGWGANESVNIILFGPLNTVGVSATARPIGNVVADGSGNFNTSIQIPYDEGGPYTIIRPGYYEVRGGAVSGFDASPPKVNICPATYKFDDIAIDWSHARGGRDGGVEGIKRVFPHWMSTWDEKPVAMYARAAFTTSHGNNQPAYITHTDFPGDHYAHDYNLLMLPEPEYRWVMGTANYHEIEDGQAKREIGRMELEWETLNGGSPLTYGNGNIGFPLFAHPTAGDLVFTVGRWILDAGHPEKGDRTEIHPARMIATIRKRPTVMPLSAEDPDCMTYARQVDIYVSGHGGGANRNFYSLSEGLGSGGRIQDVLSGEQLVNYYSGDIAESTGLSVPYFAALGGYNRLDEFQPVNDMNYEFDVALPPPPAGATGINYQVINRVNHGTAVNEIVTFTDVVDGLPTKAHVVLPYLGADNGIYSRTLKFAWNTYKQPGKHFQVRLDNFLVKDNGDNFPLAEGELFVWTDVCGQWVFLSAIDAEAFLNADDDDVISLQGRTFDVYLDPDDSIYLHTYGYEQDAIDFIFGGFGWDSAAAVIAVGSTLLVLDNPGDNDQLGGALFNFESPNKTNVVGNHDVSASAGDDGDSHYNLRFNVSYIPAPPRIEVNGVPSNFGNVCLGESMDQVIQIFNVGEEDLDVNSIEITGAGYAKLPTPNVPVTIAGGSHIDVTVRFSPTATTQGAGTIKFNSSDPCQPAMTFDLAATVVYPVASLSGALQFEQVPVDNRTVGSTSTKTFQINNTGQCELEISGVTVSAGASAGFSLGSLPNFPQTIQPGGSLEVPVNFNPAAEGPVIGIVSVTAVNDPTHPNPLTISMGGAGIVPEAAVTPTNTVFPPTVIGFSRTQNVSLFNTGPAELIIDSAVVDGAGFTLDPAVLPIRLAPNATTTVKVNFSPTAVTRGSWGTLTMATNDPDRPTIITHFCGEGVPVGFRVLVLKADGTPYATVDQVVVQSSGVTPSVNLNMKNKALVTIEPPESCTVIQFHHEMALAPTGVAAKKGSQYNVKVKVGAKAQSVSFTLLPNEFKEIVIRLK